MLMLTIILSSTQIINLPIIGLSLFQAVLIVSCGIALVGLFQQKFVIHSKSLIFVGIWLVSSVVSFYFSTNKAHAQSYLLFSIMVAFLFLVIPQYFGKHDVTLLLKMLIYSQYVTLFFSVYSFYMFYYGGGVPLKINLLAGMYIQLDQEYLLRMIAGARIRLALPYATPPVLSVVMAMSILILLLNKKIFSKVIRWGHIIVFSLLLILTGSRTGIVGLMFGLLFCVLDYLVKKNRISKKTVLGALCVLIIGTSAFLITINKVDYFKKLMEGFTGINLLQDRHFLIPLDGLIIWLSSLRYFILGIGFGSSVNMMGMHTVLPSHLMNSFVTLVVERGVAGVFLAYQLFMLPLRIGKKKVGFELATDKYAVKGALIAGLASCMFYEALDCYYLIILIAIGFILMESELKSDEHIIDNYSGI